MSSAYLYPTKAAALKNVKKSDHHKYIVTKVYTIKLRPGYMYGRNGPVSRKGQKRRAPEAGRDYPFGGF